MMTNQDKQKYHREYHRKWCQEHPEYYQEHKEEIIRRVKQYYQEHKEERKEYAKQYRQIHPGCAKNSQKKYYQMNKEIVKKRSRQWEQMPKHKEALQRSRRKYRQSENGRLVRAKTIHKRQRDLGFVPINEAFKNSAWHHLDNILVIAIPKEIHQKCYTGNNVFKHRQKVLKYYDNNVLNMLNQYKSII